ncbi:MAG: sigma-70 family RNA polymerase sigma factor [Bacteroidales bacterium]|nr:sigma-70 family RNA polymerase sigma factor [Bacteroidales bacterium]
MNSGPNTKYHQLSDAELVALYREKQDLEILGDLYKRYMYLVYGLCMKYLKNREDSQDAVMQIFEVIMHEIPRFDIRNFRGWLYGVSRNFCLMRLRKEQADRKRQDNISQEIFMESTLNLHPIDEPNNEDLQTLLQTCLEQLKQEQRQCVELFYYQQRCYKEIAEELEFDENKVKSYIQNGKRNLKICIESKAELKNVSH